MLILILLANPTYQKAKQYLIEVESKEHKEKHGVLYRSLEATHFKSCCQEYIQDLKYVWNEPR